MTTPDAHCDMCNQKFQPQRANKTGPRYCGNACRQRAHRRRSREAKLQGPPLWRDRRDAASQGSVRRPQRVGPPR